MPTVPVGRRRVGLAPVSGVRVDPNAPSGAFQPSPGIDAGAVLRAGQQLYEQHQARVDQVAVLDADNQLSQITTDLTRQALSRRGTDALGAKEEAEEGWAKATAGIEKSLTSDRAKEIFRQRAAARWQNVYATVETHADSEYKKHDAAVATEGINQRYNAALTAATPDQRDLAFAEMKAIITEHAQRNGERDLAPARIAEAVSRTHAGILEAMVESGQDLAAKDYLAQHRAELVGKDLIKSDHLLQRATKLGEAQRQADRITSGDPGLLTPGNIDLTKRPRVKNPDGSISTVRSMSFEEDGKEILVPTVTPDGKNLTETQAIARYHSTGEHLGIFASPVAATAYATRLHDAQAAMLRGEGNGTVPQGGGVLSLSAGLAEAAKIEDPEIREDTERRVRQHFNDLAADERQRQAKAFNDASAIVEKTGSFDAIPLRLRIAMSPEENGALQHRVDQIRHPKEPGDPDNYFHLLNLASLSPQSREQFAREDLSPKGYPNLSTSERQKLMTLQRQISMREDGVTSTHLMREAEAEQQRADHIAERELHQTDPVAAEALRAANFAKRQAKYHGAHPAGTATGMTVPAGPSAAHPLEGYLTPLQRPTRAMLEDVQRKGDGYAAYLRSMGYDVPKGAIPR